MAGRNLFADEKPKGRNLFAMESQGGQTPSFGEFLEPLATIGSAAIAEPIAGVAGLVQSLNPWAEEGAGAKAVEATREALTYKPEGELAQQVLGEVGGVIEPAAEKVAAVPKAIGDFTMEITGSPALATAAYSTPAAVVEILGLKGLRSLRKGTRLLDQNGRPTKVLKTKLEKQGLDFDGLSDDVRNSIPEYADPKLIPGGEVAGEAETILRKQIEAGGTEDALAGLKVQGGKVTADTVANQAIKQGFQPAVVQSIKNSSRATKNKMLKMTRMMREIKKSARKGLDFRPSDVVGDAVTNRISFIRGKADIASKQLDNIAKNKFKGKYADFAGVKKTVSDVLDELDINYKVNDKTGKVDAIFDGSIISEDRASQRSINALMRLMQEKTNPDALDMHRLKRKIDKLVNYRKRSTGGIGDDGEKVLKKARRAINDSLRATNKDYAKVNDTLSASIDALDNLDSATGTIDLFGAGSNQAIGTKMRALLSNQQGRIKLENAIKDLDNVASGLGGKFGDDIKDLVMYADALEEKFGTVAKTSFAGQAEQGVKRGIEAASSKQGAFAAAIDAAGKGVEKVRGINEYNAFEAIEKLLQ